jgi:hypothetical protein
LAGNVLEQVGDSVDAELLQALGQAGTDAFEELDFLRDFAEKHGRIHLLGF